MNVTILSDALSNTSSPEYNEAKNQILDALLDALNQAALDSGSEITNIMVVFLSSSQSTRKRRSDTSATAQLEIELSKTIKKKETEVTNRDLEVLYRR